MVRDRPVATMDRKPQVANQSISSSSDLERRDMGVRLFW